MLQSGQPSRGLSSARLFEPARFLVYSASVASKGHCKPAGRSRRIKRKSGVGALHLDQELSSGFGESYAARGRMNVPAVLTKRIRQALESSPIQAVKRRKCVGLP